MQPGNTPRLRIPWWFIILLLLFGARFWNNLSREMSSPASEVTPLPVASAVYKVQTSVQDGETEADNACQRDIDVSNGPETMVHFRAHAGETVRVCTTAYDDGLKDAAQDSGDAHYMDENNAATDEEMVSAALALEGDKAGSKNASDKAVALAKDVEENSNNPKLAAGAKETVRELIGPISSSDRKQSTH